MSISNSGSDNNNHDSSSSSNSSSSSSSINDNGNRHNIATSPFDVTTTATTNTIKNNNNTNNSSNNYSKMGELFWKTFIQPTFRPEFSNDRIFGVSALTQLLAQNMIRHTKANIPEIPKPVFKITPIQLSPQEASVYNFFACSALTNLVLTDLDYTNPGKSRFLIYVCNVYVYIIYIPQF